jgi:hypothetical protein
VTLNGCAAAPDEGCRRLGARLLELKRPRKEAFRFEATVLGEVVLKALDALIELYD